MEKLPILFQQWISSWISYVDKEWQLQVYSTHMMKRPETAAVLDISNEWANSSDILNSGIHTWSKMEIFFTMYTDNGQ